MNWVWEFNYDIKFNQIRFWFLDQKLYNVSKKKCRGIFCKFSRNRVNWLEIVCNRSKIILKREVLFWMTVKQKTGTMGWIAKQVLKKANNLQTNLNALLVGPDPGLAKRGDWVSKLGGNWLNLHDLAVKRGGPGSDQPIPGSAPAACCLQICVGKVDIWTIFLKIKGLSLKNYWTNTMLVCTRFNPLFMLNPSMVLKKFEFWEFVEKNWQLWPVVCICTKRFKGTGHDFCWSEKPIYHLQKQGNIHTFQNKYQNPHKICWNNEEKQGFWSVSFLRAL